MATDLMPGIGDFPYQARVLFGDLSYDEEGGLHSVSRQHTKHYSDLCFNPGRCGGELVFPACILNLLRVKILLHIDGQNIDDAASDNHCHS
jgi:hypothetical protein